MSKKLKLGMIGGGEGAFIGEVHRKAASLDSKFDIVCGAFSRSKEKSEITGSKLGLDSERVYESFKQLIEIEKNLPDDKKMEVVSIVTPNHVHFEPAKLALENGFHVIIDKPLTFSLEEAKELEKVVNETGNVLTLTHTYNGYPMIKEAKEIIKRGKLGKVRKIYVEYPQGWLSTPLEQEGNKQASWRTDPTKSGEGGSIGDIGTHAANLAEYVSGLKITQVCADVNIKVKNRKLDDDAAALLKFEDDASGVLIATQVAAGEENNLRLRIYGEKGGIEWNHSDANSLLYKILDEPVQILRAGTGYLSDAANANTRLPAGHPEGYFEAFANIYVEFYNAVVDKQNGKFTSHSNYDFPNVEDGVRGMAFVRTMIKSNQSDKKWTPFVK